MLKLKKYFLKYYKALLLCLVLLFAQSQAELSLPDYMSNIVSVGIQSSGFDSSVANYLSTDTYDHVKVFLNDEDVKLFEDSYKLVSNKDIDTDVKDTFKKIKDQDIYELKDISSSKQSELEDVLNKPMLIVSSIDGMDTSSQEYQEQFGQLPPNMTPYDALSMMDQTAKDEMFASIDTQMEAMGESTMKIAAGATVKGEYQKLGADTDDFQNDYIFKEGLFMLIIALAGTICAIACSFLASRIAAKIARNIRLDVFKKVESFSQTEFDKFSTASLITRTTNDITQVQMVITMFIRIVCFAPMMGIGALIRALNNSGSLTWIIGVVIILLILLIMVIFMVVMPKFKIVQTLIDKLNLSMRENLTGMLVIRAFGNEKHSEQRFDKANDDLTKVNLFVNRAMATMMPIMMFLFNGVTLAIIWYGSKQIDLGNIAIGQMMAFMQYAMQMIMSFLMLAMIAIMLPRASVAGQRIYEVLNTEVEIHDKENPQQFIEDKKGYVEFNDVTFKYPGANEPVLENISFTCKPGETTAIIGSTGSGKSTLINLIPRFYEVTTGSIKVNGVDVRDAAQHELIENIGLVPQKGLLFSGTIGSNLRYGAKDASDQELMEYARIAQATEFIENKEDGLETEIAQGGNNVSGGQKQRLAIARALAKNPDIYIFDDSFSALDFKTDAKLRSELNKLIEKTKSTVLIVGQRIASIRDANQIIVLDEGKIVGLGTHNELMSNCDVYKQIAYSQLSKEELADE